MKIPRLTTIALSAGLTLFSGCADHSQNFQRNGVYDGHPVKIWRTGDATYIRLGHTNNRKAYLSGKDIESDGRFDEIMLEGLPKNHPLEKYASADKLQEIFNHINRD